MADLKDLLDSFCCPETRQPLRPATPEELIAANRDGVVNRAGNARHQAITDGLVRDDGAVLYPIWDEIPCLLIDEGIPVQDRSLTR